MRGRKTILLTVLAVAGITSATLTPAHADPGGGFFDAPGPTEEGLLSSVGIDQSAPKKTVLLESDELPLSADDVLSIDVHLALTDIVSSDKGDAVNSVTWDKETDTVSFYVFGDDSGVRASIADTLPATQRWEIIPAVRSIATLETLIEEIAQNPTKLPSGVSFVSGTPAPDGSSISIGVQTDGDAQLRSAPLPEVLDDVPVAFTYEEPASPITRVRGGPPIIAGSYTTNSSVACTSGWPVLRNQDNQYNMLTADHCAASQNETWYFGPPPSNHFLGSPAGQAPGDTDLELYVGSASLSTWMLAGAYNNSNTVAPIRGYASPVGGTNVCYSGSRSGLVCSNVLEASDTFSCIPFPQCYWTRWTTQSAGIPAAGNGDSGGPVAILATNAGGSVGAYGVGVISMIPGNAPATCTGDPGSSATNGRKCSPNVGFAPLSRWAGSQSTHSLVYTTQ